MMPEFTLAACAEMIFTELSMTERARRIDDLGFQVEIWDWTRHDIDSLQSTGATFSSMTGYVTTPLLIIQVRTGHRRDQLSTHCTGATRRRLLRHSGSGSLGLR
jgi:hydroxypyruvate isomerase